MDLGQYYEQLIDQMHFHHRNAAPRFDQSQRKKVYFNIKKIIILIPTQLNLFL